MADFGLAAQIGRGGGGGGMAGSSPVDPTNRMMQLMQLQQLQQNMMLARQQEAREAALAPLRLEQLRAGTAADVARTTATGEQTRRYRAEADVAERENLAQKGVLEFTANVPPAERTNPERLDELRKRNPGAFSLVSESIARMRKLDEDARAAGMSATQKMFEMQRAGLQNMSSLLPAITNEKEFRAFYDDYKVLDPAGARLITPEFNDKNLRAITARIQDRQDLKFETDAFGNEFVVNTRTGTKEPVTAARPAAPAASTFGNLAAPLAAPPAAATQVIGPGAAGLASPNAMLAAGEAPIIQPRAAAPEMPALSPKALAVGQETLAREQAQADVKRQEEERLKGRVKTEFQQTLNDITDAYRDLGRQGALITPETSVGQRIKTFAASQVPGIAGVISPEMGAPIQTIENLRQSLVSALMGATGMTAKQIDSNAEMKAYLNSLTSPGQTADAIVKTFNSMSRRFGLNQTLTVADITGKPEERAPAGQRRGAAAPAIAAPPQPSIEDLLKKYQ